MAIHPYRDPSAPAEGRDSAGLALDVEELVVHGVIAVVGAAGVVVGAISSHPTELVLGGLMAYFSLRSLLRELRACRTQAR